jgi:GTP-binding protein EngB required for normal cell division/Flp pilus assembly protein TadD
VSLLDDIFSTLTGGGAVPEAVRREIAQAVACVEEGELVIAEARLLGLSDDHPDVAAVFLALGEVRSRRGHDEEAVEAYGRAVNLDKDAVEGWLGLGEALARLGRAEPARDALRRVLSRASQAPLRGRAHAARGRLAMRVGRASEAVRELRKASEACPRDRLIAADLGRALLAAGDSDGWRWLLHAAQELVEVKAPAGLAEADLVIEAARACAEPQAAEGLLRAALTEVSWPGQGKARVQAALAEILAAHGRGQEAAALAGEALAADPGDGAVLAAWRALAEENGDFAGALAAAFRAEELGASVPAATLVRLALAAQDRTALERVRGRLCRTPDAHKADELALTASLAAFLDGSAHESDLLNLAPLATTETARRFVAEILAPGAPPLGNLHALLGFAAELATRSPELQSLLPGILRAAEALGRPLLVAVMGEFNAGKSSFVNALCGAEIARVGVTPTTATINLLRFGPPGGRVHFHDGRVEQRSAAEIRAFVAEIDEATASAVRMVEIFHPLPVLQKIEVVDTPGTNSLRPEHERVARAFLVEADAIVWVFSLNQAGKASERGVLDRAHAAGKRVLGVLNKADQAAADDVAALLAHVQATLGDRVEALVPLSARDALAAHLASDSARLEKSGMSAVQAALQERFFQNTHTLKQRTASAALADFVERAGDLCRAARPADDGELARRRAELDASEARLAAALAGERLNLAANLDDGFRRAAAETLALAEPRGWIAKSPRAAADEEFLLDLLDEVVTGATEASKTALLAAATGAPALPIAASVDQFAAYARGMLAGGVAERFLQQALSRSRADVEAAAATLTRKMPDAEAELFAPLAARVRAVFADTRADLALQAARQSMANALLDARLARPLDALKANVLRTTAPTADPGAADSTG